MTARGRRKPRGRSKTGSTRRSKQGRRGAKRSLGGTVAVFTGCALLAALGVGLVHEESGTIEEPAREAIVWNGGRVRVDVQNAGEVTGMAHAATGRLRSAGFDVVKYGNAPVFDHERPSVVIDRVGRTDQAQAVAKALGIDNVLSEPDPNLYVDVTVVLGRSWDPDAPVGRLDQSASRAWWDPRGWFDG